MLVAVAVHGAPTSAGMEWWNSNDAGWVGSSYILAGVTRPRVSLMFSPQVLNWAIFRRNPID